MQSIVINALPLVTDKHVRLHPSHSETERHALPEDVLAPAKGVIAGMLICLPFWAIVYAVVF
jgi:hypothetical protein